MLPQQYYQTLIDCELNGNGTVDLDTIVVDGTIPRCFYSGYVRKGKWLDNSDGCNRYDLWARNLTATPRNY